MGQSTRRVRTEVLTDCLTKSPTPLTFDLRSLLTTVSVQIPRASKAAPLQNFKHLKSTAGILAVVGPMWTVEIPSITLHQMKAMSKHSCIGSHAFVMGGNQVDRRVLQHSQAPALIPTA